MVLAGVGSFDRLRVTQMTLFSRYQSAGSTLISFSPSLFFRCHPLFSLLSYKADPSSMPPRWRHT